MRLRWLAGACAALFVSAAAAQTGKVDEREPQGPQVWPSLERFADEAELRAYVRELQRLSGRGNRAAVEESIVVTGSAVPAPMAPPPPPPPPPAAAPSPAPLAADSAPAAAGAEATSITNVQMRGVDEGGIVKQIGRFLIVLQDGRLFVVDTRPNGEPGLALVNRADVYRRPGAATWYDEMLVAGNRILVTGYSYGEAASEITIFSIDERGALTRETAYYLSSNDYYSGENYATRLVDGNLVIYTPLDLSYVDASRPMRWPLVRRWLRDDERRAVTTAGRPLFDAQDIYKPIQRTMTPFVHSVSVCPLGEARSGDELECRTTAFMGPARREFYVTTSDIYLWVTPGWNDEAEPCEGRRGRDAYSVPATLYRAPLTGAPPQALHVRGQPNSRLALDASATEFRALLDWNSSHCNRRDASDLRYFRAPLSSFGAAPISAPARSYTELPSPGAANYEMRFTDAYLVYGGRNDYRTAAPREGGPQTGRIVVVPVERPQAPAELDAPHGVIRIERAGANDVVLTGYRTDAGLSLSLVDLSGRPRVASSTTLNGRYESENRSHAFNALIGADDSGLMGLPTVRRVKESGRWVWRSQASDVSFISTDAAGQLRSAGELEARANAQHPTYRCEVSCVDWYGNTRALYIGSRVFALSATELIEGALAQGRVGETRRINLSAPVGR